MAVLRDNQGKMLAPTLIPPTIEFPHPEESNASSSTSLSKKGPEPEEIIGGPRKSHTLPLDASTQRFSADLPSTTPIGHHLMRMETAPTQHETVPSLRRIRSDRPQMTKIGSLLGSKRRPVFKPGQAVQPPGIDRAVSYTLDNYSATESDTSAGEDGSESEEEGTGGETSQTGGVAKEKRRRSSAEHFNRFAMGNKNHKTKGKVSRRDGRLKISIKEHASTGFLAKSLNASFKRGLKGPTSGKPTLAAVAEGAAENAISVAMKDERPLPKLNIVIMVIGSRGDIQPFIKIGKILKEDHGHRVRIATHPAFRKFVEKDSGLEFFSIGGDASELMSYMVKNPGLIPSVETVRQGEIGRRRAAMYEMFQGMWRACINATDDETDRANLNMMGDKRAFVADAIIANPPSFAHVHIAERLGIPLHMMFTFPYTPTTQFPHPLANVKSTNVDSNYTNFISYPLVDMMTWQGLGDLINRFRRKTLGLEPVSTLWAPGQLYRLKVPYTYMWSPGLVPKPSDWGPEIDIAGFVFLELASSFKPSQELTKFLDSGPPPVYIGFGSIVVDDPEGFTQMIFDAVKMAGVRALVSKGWGGFGGNGDAPENVFFLGNTPHDWLFPKCSAVVHHGGAGTTAMGLKCARPTMIVPFFGDQPFWGSMVASAKAGAHECIPWKQLTTEKLAEGIKQCLTDEAKQNAQKIADSIAEEGDGAANAVSSFHRHLPLQGGNSMRCSILDERVAAWHMKGTKLRLSAIAADILTDRGKLKWSQLRLIRHRDWTDFGGAGEPLTGVGTSLVRTTMTTAKGFAMIPVNMIKSIKKRESHNERKKRLKLRQQKKLEQMQKSGHMHGPEFVEAKKVSSHPEEEQERPPNKREDSDPMLNRPRRPTAERGDTNISKISADPSENIVEEFGHETVHGVSKAGKAIVKAPMDLTVAIQQGFHNAPRLYGDETVRRPLRVSGFHSGLRAGRNELLYGIHDAFTGLYTHPRDGVKREGFFGLVKGVGIGVGGLFLKNLAAVMGPGAYTLKGVHMEMRKKQQPTVPIRRARINQGRTEIYALSPTEVEDTVESVLRGWEVVSTVIDTERKKTEAAKKQKRSTTKAVVNKAHLNFAHLSERHKQRRRTVKLQSVQIAERTLRAEKKGMTLEEFEKSKEGNQASEGGVGEAKDAGRKSRDSKRSWTGGLLDKIRRSEDGNGRPTALNGTNGTAKKENKPPATVVNGKAKDIIGNGTGAGKQHTNGVNGHALPNTAAADFATNRRPVGITAE